MRHIVLAAALLFAVSSQSQQTSQPAPAAAPTPLVEKIDVSVVNVDVTVSDRHGRPVTGLTRSDFEILEDGKPQPISNFYAVEEAQVRSDVRPEAGTETITTHVGERFRRKVLVLIDNLNTSMHARNEALDKLEAFVNDHFDDGRYDWSIATIDSRVHLLLPMTSDKRVLHDVVAGIRHSASHQAIQAPINRSEPVSQTAINSNNTFGDDPAGTKIHEQNQDLVTATTNFDESANLTEQVMFASQSTDAIVEAARAFGSSEGRKIIVLVTGNLPLGASSPLTRVGESNHLGSHIQDIADDDARLTSLSQSLVREANASNTSVYIISAEGLKVPGWDASSSSAGDISGPGSIAPDTGPMYWLARQTGGAYMPGNRIDQSFVELDRRSASFYSLGYMPQHPEDGHYHRLIVHVKGYRESDLQYREGYSSTSTDLQMMRALRSPLGAAMQPSTMAVTLIVGKPEYRGIVGLVPVKVAMSMESLQYITDGRGSRTRLHVYVSIFDPDGRNITLAKAFADIAVLPNESTSGPMTVTIPPLLLAKGTYRVVVAVRDELTDHVGTVTQKINL